MFSQNIQRKIALIKTRSECFSAIVLRSTVASRKGENDHNKTANTSDQCCFRITVNEVKYRKKKKSPQIKAKNNVLLETAAANGENSITVDLKSTGK